MPKQGNTRKGSMQFYPRVRAKKIIPRVSWQFISKNKGMLGFIGYKVGMKSAYLRDNCPTSLTKGQRIVLPVTIVECPTLKIFSVRFYKNKKVMNEVLSSVIDKEVKKKVKLPKTVKKKIDDFEGKYDDVRILVYSQVKKTGIKKKPDFAELGLGGSLDEKINFIKEHLNKEISIKDYLTDDFMKHGLIDVRGVTTGRGNQGAAKRFGLALRSHKSEKGVRGPGSGGAWHPSRVEFTQPMSGQMGYFTRVVYNNKILNVGNVKEKDINEEKGFKNFGKIRGEYVILCGSIQGPSKRQLLLTSALRPSREQLKKNYEFLELR